MRTGATRPQEARQSEEGFSMIELLVVLVILGLLTSIAAPRVLGHLGRARADTAKLEMRSFQTALDMFVIDIGRYPTQQEGLNALMQPPERVTGWNGPYLEVADLPQDPWGRPYQYRMPGQNGKYEIFSLGADNAPGGTGDDADIVMGR